MQPGIVNRMSETSPAMPLDPALVDDLKRRGHLLEPAGFVSFGGAQMIRRLENGAFAAARDNRKDGHAVGF